MFTNHEKLMTKEQEREDESSLKRAATAVKCQLEDWEEAHNLSARQSRHGQVENEWNRMI